MRVGPSGPLNARIFVVGEAPGEVEQRMGEPFVGPAGSRFRGWLNQVGIPPESVFFTNLCKYRPEKNKLHTFFLDGGIPTRPVIDGLAELIEEINQVWPNVILALGNFPLRFLTNKGRWIDEERDGKRIRGFTGITDWRGSVLPCTLVPGLKVVPTFHPSYLIQEGLGDHGTFLADLGRVKEEARFPEIKRPSRLITVAWERPKVCTNYWQVIEENARPTWDDSPLDRDQIRDRLLYSPDKPTTLDIEYINNKLLCCGLATTREEAYVIPTESLRDLFYMETIIRPTRKFNAQNSMFDASILEWHYNLPIMERVTFDTMVAAYCANVELQKDLGYLFSIYVESPYAYKNMIDWQLVKKGKQSIESVYIYNGTDAWGQHEVMEEQIKHEFTDPNVERSFRFLMRLLVPLWKMSKRGIKIDLDLMKNVGVELDGEAAYKNFELMFLANRKEPINVKSGPQVAELLFNQLGLTPSKINKTGPATDDKTLAALLLKAETDEQKKAITLIRQIRNARDLRSKFFDIGFDQDGRMRGHYDPTKTVTGRLASRKFYPTGSGTNQQNIPRDKRARRAFIADRGKIFGYADLERAESLVVAHLTMDPLMLLDHAPGQNAHRNLGSRFFNKPPEEIDETEYYISKQARHAGGYMEGPIIFMRNFNQKAHQTGISITQKEAEFFIYGFRNMHTGLKPWWDATAAAAPHLKNLIGFPRTFYDTRKLPEMVAFVPQSTVGQDLNIGLLTMAGVPSPYLQDRGIWHLYEDIYPQLMECGFEMLQQIHDAIGFQCREKDAERVVPLLRRAMSIPLRNPNTYEDFTIPVEVLMDLDPEHFAAGRSNWGDCKVYKKDLEHA